jgi:hypothetical protein
MNQLAPVGDGVFRLACGEGRHAARGDRERACRDLHPSSFAARDPRRPPSCAWAALRYLFDWIVIGQIMPTNPAAAVSGPRNIAIFSPFGEIVGADQVVVCLNRLAETTIENLPTGHHPGLAG